MITTQDFSDYISGQGYDGVIMFPEYSMSFEDIRRFRPDLEHLTQEQITELAVVGYKEFLQIKTCLEKVQFPISNNEYKLTASNGYAVYRMKGFRAYMERQVELAPRKTFQYNGQRNMDLIVSDLINGGVSEICYGFDDREVLLRSGYSHSFAPQEAWIVAQQLEIMAALTIERLTAHGILATGENVLKMWTLEKVAESNLVCYMHSEPNDDKAMAARIMDLIKHKIPIEHALTAISWYGNPRYASTGEFTYSAEDLANFNDIPDSYMDHIIWEEFKAVASASS